MKGKARGRFRANARQAREGFDQALDGFGDEHTQAGLHPQPAGQWAEAFLGQFARFIERGVDRFLYQQT